MKPIVVTSGQAFADIDAVACAIAYAELLTLEGRKAQVVFPGTLNNSVTESIKSWGLTYQTTPTHTESEYVLVDVSDPEYIASCAKEGIITEVYDHHPGFESYWEQKIGDGAHIEPIGAAATLIWETFKKHGQSKNISEHSAKLLAVAILSNTLNFGAHITHERDHTAYAELQARFPLSDEWIKDYFTEQEKAALHNVRESIISDTKVLTLPGLSFSFTVGQLELWDGSTFLKNNTETICSTLESFGHDHWIMSIPSLSEKRITFIQKMKRSKNSFPKRLI